MRNQVEGAIYRSLHSGHVADHVNPFAVETEKFFGWPELAGRSLEELLKREWLCRR